VEPQGSFEKAAARFWQFAPKAALAVSLLVVAVAARNRIPWSDEGLFSSASYNLAHHGFLGTTVLESAGTGLTRIERHTYWVMPLYLLGQALWYKFVPASVLLTRTFTLLSVPLALWAFHVFLSRLLPQTRTPALGVCLLALSFIFLDNAGFARPDLLCCTLGLWGLATYLLLRERSLVRALFVSNAFIAASGLTHPNGVFHLCGLLVLVLWYDRSRLSVPALAAAAAPYVLFGAAWSLYILRDVPAFLDQTQANGINNERWPNTLNPFVLVWNEIRDRYVVAFGFMTRGFALAKAFALVAYGASVVVCLIEPRLRNKPSTRLLLLLLAVYFAAMSVFNQKLSYYLIHILPIYVALLAVVSAWVWNNYRRARPLVAAGLLALVSIETGGILLKAYQRSYVEDQRAAVRYLLAHTGPSDRIVGSASLIYEMGFDPRLRDDVYLGLRSGRVPDAVVIESLFRAEYASWEKQGRPDVQRIRARLSTYRLAYRQGAYEVYLRSGN
jgi:hypothetical protein